MTDKCLTYGGESKELVAEIIFGGYLFVPLRIYPCQAQVLLNRILCIDPVSIHSHFLPHVLLSLNSLLLIFSVPT